VQSGGEVDAALWRRGHVALIEITTSRILDAAVHSGDRAAIRAAVRRTFVERTSTGETPYREAVLQLARDVEALLAGAIPGVQCALPPQRIYPVVIALDKRVRAPGLWRYLDAEFRQALAPATRSFVAALAVLSFEDLEEVDQAVRDGIDAVRGSPGGFLKLLRRWDLDRGPVAPAWWQYMGIINPKFHRNELLVKEAEALRSEIEAKFVDKD
jgi:hypothetical protein